jgi:hypothetical protein
LPKGVTATEITGVDWARNQSEELECTIVPLQCTDQRAVPPDDTLQVTIRVEVTSATGTVTSMASVTGGGAPTATASRQSAIGSGVAPFEIQDFGFGATASDGATDAQAGDHPYEQSTSFDLTTYTNPGEREPYGPVEQPKDVVVTLPAGFVGDPQAAQRCPLILLDNAEIDRNPESPTDGQFITQCPKSSRVGVVTVASNGLLFSGSLFAFAYATSVFNIEPEGGHPAELGFRYHSNVIVMYADVVHTDGEYRLRVKIPGIPQLGVYLAGVTLFGQPGARDGEPSATSAFVTNPARCTSQPVTAKIEIDSWEEPSQWISKETAAYSHIEGCDRLQFNPEVHVLPETSQADTPSGYEVDLKVPRAATPQGVLQTPQLKDATFAFPAGVSVSPSAADGLAGCEATGPYGIDLPHGMPHPDEAGEGEAIGADGLSHLTSGHCPPKSEIGEVELATPLLAAPLKGHVYLAQPKCGGEGQPECTETDASNGHLFSLYVELGGQPGEGSGVIIKLEGTAAVDPVTGEVTTSFKQNPQLPFGELKVRLYGGPLAPLSNPQACGTFMSTSDLVPWSTPVTPDAVPFSHFDVTGCSNPMAFAPSFSAGTTTPNAASFSTFTLTLSRADGQQDISGLTTRLPPGLVGMVSNVALCEEPRARAGSCPEASRIGTTTVAAGAGSHPFWLSGRVYLTGPYNGAPFGLSIVVPAKAGPFNLGNEVVRAAINVDPNTSAVTVTSGPIPQIKDGVPFRLKTINVTIDRSGFMLNPTNCEQQSIKGTIAAAQGARASVSSPFAVTGCANLPFKPTFTVSTQGRTSKANGASLTVKVAQKPGEANIHKVNLQLPLILPARLTTLQKACTEAQFNANLAGCPAASVIGTATAITPVLSVPLTGPAYLVSHGGAAFPDVEFVLQGQGVMVVLDGGTDIKKGITYSRFETVPDAPISSFETILPEGPHSALAANGDLCSQTRIVTVRKRVVRRVHGRTRRVLRSVREVTAPSLSMPTAFVAQNGAQIHQSTPIKVTGCARHKRAKKARHKTRRKRK